MSIEICYRLRTIVLRNQPSVHGPQIYKATFVEYFVETVDALGPNACLGLPRKVPQRFQGRIADTDTLWIQSQKVNVHRIASEAPTVIQKRTRENILKDGAWLVRHDFLPKGGIPELNVPFCAMFQGLPISIEATRVIEEASFQIAVRHALNAVEDPLVVQHGTDRALVKNIVKDTFLRPTFGMLGNAIQLGSFWKAQRYAEMDASFGPRDGALFRVFAWWPYLKIRMPGLSKCQCKDCIQQPLDSINVATDHEATWASSHIAVWVGPWKQDNGKWTVKNEEFATQDPQSIFLDSVGYVPPSSDVQRDPLRRDLCIL